MRKDIHPDNYRLCVFKDMGTGDQFITRSCANTRDTVEVDGVEYPLVKMEISGYSHPFYTGKSWWIQQVAWTNSATATPNSKSDAF